MSSCLGGLENERTADLHIFVQMHRLVVDVVLHEEVVNAGQQGHLRQGEDVHELLHGVAVGALQDGADHIRFFAFQPQLYK